MGLFVTPPGKLSWGQKLDRAFAGAEKPITLPPLSPPTHDRLATAYPEHVPAWAYWAVVGAAVLAAVIGGVTAP